jgi:hypothetical protein
MTTVLEEVPTLKNLQWYDHKKFTNTERDLIEVLHMIWSNRIAINANDIEALKEYTVKSV